MKLESTPQGSEDPTSGSDSWPRVSVVMPTLNEAHNLQYVLPRMPADVFEVVLVDGGSTDDTIRNARQLRSDIRIVQQTRRGKGNAISCGFAAARGDIVVMLDADGSANPAEIRDFVQTLLEGAHFAKGTRCAKGGGSDDITRLRAWGNRWLNRLVNMRYDTSYTDLCYGYNAMWREIVPWLIDEEAVREISGLELRKDRPIMPSRWGDGFEIETLLNVRVSMLGFVVREVGSVEACRVHGRSNLNAFRDGMRVLRTIAAERRRFASAASNPPQLAPWNDDDRVIDLTRALDARTADTIVLPDAEDSRHVPDVAATIA